MSIETSTGASATITFDGARCIHARRCVIGAPGAFKADVAGPWLDADAADAETLLRIALACPSGAITVTRTDGGPQEAPPPANIVILRENGPLAIHAELTIEGHGAMTRATLCRCGLSRNKPYCDNSHIAAGFVATGEPAAKPSTLAIADLIGPVTVKPAPNGPLIVSGRLEIESGTGRKIERVEKTFLCRCGQSANKPYCDGSHKDAGFVAP